MSRKQLAEQRRYGILESELTKNPKPVKKDNWYQEYSRQYKEMLEKRKEGGKE